MRSEVWPYSFAVTQVHLAQINIGTMVAPTDDPRVAEFMDNLERINALADAADGFVWRLQTEAGNATSIQVFSNPLELVNLSVWTSLDALRAYVYRSEHVEFFRRRAEWFERDAKRVALFTVRAGTLPSLNDAIRRVEFLERHGPSPYAFGFAHVPLPVVIEETSLDDADTAQLVRQLNLELASVATEPNENHFSLTVDETSGANGRMLRAHYDGRLVGCGAVRRIEPTVGEVKRMYVEESVRGLKIGAAILDQIELVAIGLDITELKLETGVRQIAAMNVYERAGYAPCDPWGEYVESAATSRCYTKRL
jgi:GNAT superfamily N-acetyltransferase